MKDGLGELFREARQYGRVRIMTFDDGRYTCTIEFNSIENTVLEAKSGYSHKEPEDAVIAAIAKAKEIVGSMQTTVEKFKNLLRLK